jgi:hypothetical protein
MMHARGVAAAVTLSLVVACGCVDTSSAPGAEGSISPPAAPSSTGRVPGSPGSVAPSARPSPTESRAQSSSPTSTLSLTVDPSLEASLPERIGTMRYERHSLAPGGSPPAGFGDDLGRALLRAAGSENGRLSVAWSVPIPSAADPRYDVTFLAIRIPGANARSLRDVIVLDWLLVPGFSGGVRLESSGPTYMLLVGQHSVVSSQDTLYLLSFPAFESAPPGPLPVPPFTPDEVEAALPATDPEPGPQPPARPTVPSVAPETSPPPDPAAEALLPDRVRGIPVMKVSGHGPALFSGGWIHLGIPAYLLSTELDLDLREVSVAGGHPDGMSTFVIVATPLPGLEARTILAAWFRPQLYDGLQIESVDVDGRIALLYSNQSVYAKDGVLYWMAYLDLGEFPISSPPPRPTLRELVIDTLRALP